MADAALPTLPTVSLTDAGGPLASVIQQLSQASAALTAAANAIRGAQSGGQIQNNPPGQDYLEALARTQQRRSAADQHAEWLASPAGQQAARQMGQERQGETDARSKAAKLEELAQTSLLAQALKACREQTAQFTQTMRAGVGYMQTASSWAGMASPNTAATFSGSMGMVQSRLGELLVPLVEVMSRRMQDVAAFYDRLPKTITESIPAAAAKVVEAGTSRPGVTTIGAASGALYGGRIGSVFGPLGMGIGAAAGGVIGGVAGYFASSGPQTEYKRSMAGLPSANIMGDITNWYDAAMVKALNTGVNTTEADRENKAAMWLEKVFGVLTEIKDRPASNFNPFAGPRRRGG